MIDAVNAPFGTAVPLDPLSTLDLNPMDKVPTRLSGETTTGIIEAAGACKSGRC